MQQFFLTNTEKDLSHNIVSFDKHFIINEALYTGVQVVGATGSGKSALVILPMYKAFVESGIGGVCLCHKTGDSENYKKIARKAGRTKDIIMIGPKHRTRFNFLEHEKIESDNNSFGVVDMMMQLITVTSDQKKTQGGDFWDKAVNELLNFVVRLLIETKTTISAENIIYTISSAPKQANALSTAGSQFVNIWNKLDENNRDYKALEYYFLNKFPTDDDKTKANILASVSVLMTSFLMGDLKDIFCNGLDFSMRDILNGKILIVDYSTATDGNVAKIANCIAKHAFQKQAIRRGVMQNHENPAFIIMDESQNFVTKTDLTALEILRESGIFSIFGTQSISNYRHLHSKEFVDAFLDKVKNKFVFQLECLESRNYFAELFGKDVLTRKGTSEGTSTGSNFSVSGGESTSEQVDFLVPPIRFGELECPTPSKTVDVREKWGEGYFYKSGEKFPNPEKPEKPRQYIKFKAWIKPRFENEKSNIKSSSVFNFGFKFEFGNPQVASLFLLGACIYVLTSMELGKQSESAIYFVVVCLVLYNFLSFWSKAKDPNKNIQSTNPTLLWMQKN